LVIYMNKFMLNKYQHHIRQFFCGKIIGAYKECLIINSFFINKEKEFVMGNIVFINERMVKAITEIDNNGTIQDLFFRSKKSLELKKFIRK